MRSSGAKPGHPHHTLSKLQTYDQIHNCCLKLLALGVSCYTALATEASPCEQLGPLVLLRKPPCAFCFYDERQMCCPLSLLDTKTLHRNSGMLWEIWRSHSLSPQNQMILSTPARWLWRNLLLGVVATGEAVASRGDACSESVSFIWGWRAVMSPTAHMGVGAGE